MAFRAGSGPRNIELASAVANAGRGGGVERTRRQSQHPHGYLSAWHELDPPAARAAIDAATNDVGLIQWVPQLESAVGLNGSSVERLTRALAAGAPAWAFSTLSWGRLTDAMSPPDLAGVLSSLAAAPDGWAVAVDVLSMRLRWETGDREKLCSLLTLGRSLLLRLNRVPRRPKDLITTFLYWLRHAGGSRGRGRGD